MDTFSHGLWSYLIWHKARHAWLAVLFGMLPDLLSLSPVVAHNMRKGRFKQLLSEKDLPKAIQKYKSIMFPITHSMIIALFTSATVFAIWGFQWWILAWPLHIAIDIPTHRKKQGTPFLWPISWVRVHGNHWQKTEMVLGNASALAAAYLIVFIF